MNKDVWLKESDKKKFKKRWFKWGEILKKLKGDLEKMEKR